MMRREKKVIVSVLTSTTRKVCEGWFSDSSNLDQTLSMVILSALNVSLPCSVLAWGVEGANLQVCYRVCYRM